MINFLSAKDTKGHKRVAIENLKHKEIQELIKLIP